MDFEYCKGIFAGTLARRSAVMQSFVAVTYGFRRHFRCRFFNLNRGFAHSALSFSNPPARHRAHEKEIAASAPTTGKVH